MLLRSAGTTARSSAAATSYSKALHADSTAVSNGHQQHQMPSLADADAADPTPPPAAPGPTLEDAEKSLQELITHLAGEHNLPTDGLDVKRLEAPYEVCVITFEVQEGVLRHMEHVLCCLHATVREPCCNGD